MLPRLSSYLLSDHSTLWRLGMNNFKDLPMRHEHQLFPGLAAAILLLIGMLWKKTDEKLPFLQIHATSLLIIFLITISVNEKSLYYLLLKIPGYNSIAQSHGSNWYFCGRWLSILLLLLIEWFV